MKNLKRGNKYYIFIVFLYFYNHFITFSFSFQQIMSPSLTLEPSRGESSEKGGFFYASTGAPSEGISAQGYSLKTAEDLGLKPDDIYQISDWLHTFSGAAYVKFFEGFDLGGFNGRNISWNEYQNALFSWENYFRIISAKAVSKGLQYKEESNGSNKVYSLLTTDGRPLMVYEKGDGGRENIKLYLYDFQIGRTSYKKIGIEIDVSKGNFTFILNEDKYLFTILDSSRRPADHLQATIIDKPYALSYFLLFSSHIPYINFDGKLVEQIGYESLQVPQVAKVMANVFLKDAQGILGEVGGFFYSFCLFDKEGKPLGLEGVNFIESNLDYTELSNSPFKDYLSTKGNPALTKRIYDNGIIQLFGIVDNKIVFCYVFPDNKTYYGSADAFLSESGSLEAEVYELNGTMLYSFKLDNLELKDKNISSYSLYIENKKMELKFDNIQFSEESGKVTHFRVQRLDNNKLTALYDFEIPEEGAVLIKKISLGGINTFYIKNSPGVWRVLTQELLGNSTILYETSENGIYCIFQLHLLKEMSRDEIVDATSWDKISDYIYNPTTSGEFKITDGKDTIIEIYFTPEGGILQVNKGTHNTQYLFSGREKVIPLIDFLINSLKNYYLNNDYNFLTNLIEEILKNQGDYKDYKIIDYNEVVDGSNRKITGDMYKEGKHIHYEISQSIIDIEKNIYGVIGSYNIENDKGIIRGYFQYNYTLTDKMVGVITSSVKLIEVHQNIDGTIGKVIMAVPNYFFESGLLLADVYNQIICREYNFDSLDSSILGINNWEDINEVLCAFYTDDDIKKETVSNLSTRATLIRGSLRGLSNTQVNPQIETILSIEPAGADTYFLEKAVGYDAPLLTKLLDYLGIHFDGKTPIILDLQDVIDYCKPAVGEPLSGYSYLDNVKSIWNNLFDLLEKDLTAKGYRVERMGPWKIKITPPDNHAVYRKLKVIKDISKNMLTIEEYSSEEYSSRGEYLGKRELVLSKDYPLASLTDDSILQDFIMDYYIFDEAMGNAISVFVGGLTLEEERVFDALGNLKYGKRYNVSVTPTEIWYYDYFNNQSVKRTFIPSGEGYIMSSVEGSSLVDHWIPSIQFLNMNTVDVLKDALTKANNSWEVFWSNLKNYNLKNDLTYQSTIYPSPLGALEKKQLVIHSPGGFQVVIEYIINKSDSRILNLYLDYVIPGSTAEESIIHHRFQAKQEVLNGLTDTPESLYNLLSLDNLVYMGSFEEPQTTGKISLDNSNNAISIVEAFIEAIDKAKQYALVINFQKKLQQQKCQGLLEGIEKVPDLWDKIASSILSGIQTITEFISNIVHTINPPQSGEGPDSGTLAQIPVHEFKRVFSSVFFDPLTGKIVMDFSRPHYENINENTFSDYEDFKKWVDSLIGNLVKEEDKEHLYKDILWKVYKAGYPELGGDEVEMDFVYFYFLLRGREELEEEKRKGRVFSHSDKLEDYLKEIEDMGYKEVVKYLTFPHAEDLYEPRDGQIAGEIRFFDFTWKHLFLAGGLVLSFISPWALAGYLDAALPPALTIGGLTIPKGVVISTALAIQGAMRGSTMFLPFIPLMGNAGGGDIIDFLNNIDDIYLTNTVYSLIFGIIFNPGQLGVGLGLEGIEGIELMPGNLISLPFNLSASAATLRFGQDHPITLLLKTLNIIFGYGEYVTEGFLKLGAKIGECAQGTLIGSFLSPLPYPSMGNIGQWIYMYLGESLLEEELQPAAMEYSIFSKGSGIPQVFPLGSQSLVVLAKGALRDAECFGNYAEMTDPLETPLGLLLIPSMIAWGRQHSLSDILGLELTGP